MIEKKRCTKCNRKQSLSNFHKRTASPDGLQLICKQCTSERTQRRAKSTLPKPRHKANTESVEPITVTLGKVASKQITDIARQRKSTTLRVLQGLLRFAITTYSSSQDKLTELAEIERERHMQEVGFLREPNTKPLYDDTIRQS
jgi:hypothetical protein